MQVHRRHYTTHLMAYETLYDRILSSQAKESFLENYESQTSRLQVFTDIHDDSDSESEEAIFGEEGQPGGYLSNSDNA